MEIKTRIFYYFEYIIFIIAKKNKFFKNNFSKALFFLFNGFLIGNLFGSFLNTLRELFIWDGFIISVIVIFIEILNFLIYHSKKRCFFILNFCLNSKNSFFLKSLNYFKLGIMLGFFIDAFKVGS
jgi:small-conductance mechanosensitive channel